MGFSRQEYWSGWPFPSPGDLPNPGIELESPALQADSSPSQPPGKPKGNRCDIYKFRGFGESSEALPFKHTSILTSYLLFEFNHQNLKEITFTYSTNVFNIFVYYYCACCYAIAQSCPTLATPWIILLVSYKMINKEVTGANHDKS